MLHHTQQFCSPEMSVLDPEIVIGAPAGFSNETDRIILDGLS
jgi:hypothetical protein